jgi:adenylate cyclase
MALEIELKLSFPEEALPALLRHPLIANAPRGGEPEVLDSTYFDTPDLTLLAHKVALRLRQQGKETIQTVKSAADSISGLTQRPEWEQIWSGSFDFSAITDPETAALLTRVQDELVPVFTTRFRRDIRRFHPGEGVTILAMIDTGTIATIEHDVPVRELELELIEGHADDLFRLADELKKTLPLTHEDISKAQRGYQLIITERAQ